MRTIPVIFAVVLLGCPSAPPAIPTPTPAADSSYCGAMCAHIGPHGLNCPEGQDIYDSALPGDAGVPNEPCTVFCLNQQDHGVYLNPKCVAEVTSCAEIEAARLKTCP